MSSVRGEPRAGRGVQPRENRVVPTLACEVQEDQEGQRRVRDGAGKEEDKAKSCTEPMVRADTVKDGVEHTTNIGRACSAEQPYAAQIAGLCTAREDRR